MLLASLLLMPWASVGCHSVERTPTQTAQARGLSPQPHPHPVGEARGIVLDWFRSEGIDVDERHLQWGPTTPEPDGSIRVSAFVYPGRDETGAEICRSYFLVLDRGVVRSAWGPRAVGSGCTCDYPAVVRIK